MHEASNSEVASPFRQVCLCLWSRAGQWVGTWVFGAGSNAFPCHSLVSHFSHRGCVFDLGPRSSPTICDCESAQLMSGLLRSSLVRVTPLRAVLPVLGLALGGSARCVA